MNEEYKPIGSDAVKIYGFRFGMYRYQVEHFDHNKSNDVKNDNPNMLRCVSFWDSLCGTRIYKFRDSEYEYSIMTALYMDDFIEEAELKKMILDDVINWKYEDPYDYKDMFITDKYNRVFYNPSKLFPKEEGRVEHNYPICEEPYEKCPICGGELDGSVEEIECAVDIFNSKGGYGYEGEAWGEWDEIHRCPHCDKLFCVEVWT